MVMDVNSMMFKRVVMVRLLLVLLVLVVVAVIIMAMADGSGLRLHVRAMTHAHPPRGCLARFAHRSACEPSACETPGHLASYVLPVVGLARLARMRLHLVLLCKKTFGF